MHGEAVIVAVDGAPFDGAGRDDCGGEVVALAVAAGLRRDLDPLRAKRVVGVFEVPAGRAFVAVHEVKVGRIHACTLSERQGIVDTYGAAREATAEAVVVLGLGSGEVAEPLSAHTLVVIAHEIGRREALYAP